MCVKVGGWEESTGVCEGGRVGGECSGTLGTGLHAQCILLFSS